MKNTNKVNENKKATNKVENKKVSRSANNKVESKKVDYSKMTLEQILNLPDDQIDEKIIESLLSENKDIQSFSKKKTKNGKAKLYKDSAYKENESSKRFRDRIRKERNNLINSINTLRNDKENLKNAIKAFDIFYKKTYSLNDYSLESLGRKNSDNDTMANVKLALNIIRLNK